MIRILLSVRLGELRMTQAELSRKSGVRQATINELYNEVTDRISLTEIFYICKALDCTMFDLFYMDEKDPSDPKAVPAIPKQRT